MSHGHEAKLPNPPERMRFPSSLLAVSGALVVAGGAAFGWALSSGQADLAWSAYLIGAFYALGLAVFGTLWVSILYLSKGIWSVTMRRIPEAMSSWVLPGGVLALLVGLGAHSLYPWSIHEVVAEDPILQRKAPFLNMTMFYVLSGGCILLWSLFSGLMVRNSLKQDETGESRHSHQNVMLSGAFVVVFALSFSLISYYFLMSLEPHWASTMFAVLTFTDVAQTGLAMICLIAAFLVLRGSLGSFLNENHLHSAGKMLFAFTGFWAYIYFCQFLLIWYGNIPEETSYFLRRTENGWLPFLLILPLIKFVIPFLYLAPRENKRRPIRLIFASAVVLFAQFWELFLMVSPALGGHGGGAHAHLPVVELVVALGFVAAFFLVFALSLSRRGPVPLKDPFIRECLQLHQ